MSRIVLVHGIGQQVSGGHTLAESWYPSLADGLALHGASVGREEVTMAFYGDLFRPAGHRGVGLPDLDASDVTDDVEQKVLLAWWEQAARQESGVDGPADRTRLRTPYIVQRALNALSHSSFFAGLSERLLILSARQVRRYLTDPAVRGQVQGRMTAAVTDRTRVIVAHSLGSVVGYEWLCAHSERRDITFVTLGSPLAVRNIVFDRLRPAPVDGRAYWPACVRSWHNIADRGDAVALVKNLGPAFGGQVEDCLVHNGAKAHDARPYLTARETGEAILSGLGGEDGRKSGSFQPR
ncbi:hypothetical protein [Streptomyces rimosus]|uniref:hypothetical protein n=1 Tax=Streptomyces rimosus TaxID=1927 RepID=UPI00067B5239|nr:hypothetical protein [Streptomyces rimosus]